jgi:hypothetical protein
MAPVAAPNSCAKERLENLVAILLFSPYQGLEPAHMGSKPLKNQFAKKRHIDRSPSHTPSAKPTAECFDYRSSNT